MTVEITALAHVEPGRPITATAWNEIIDSLGLLRDAVNGLGSGEAQVAVFLKGGRDKTVSWPPIRLSGKYADIDLKQTIDILKSVKQGKRTTIHSSEMALLQALNEEFGVKPLSPSTPPPSKATPLPGQFDALLEMLQATLDATKQSADQGVPAVDGSWTNPAEVVAVSQDTGRVIRAAHPFPGRAAHTLYGLGKGVWTLHVTAPGHKPQTRQFTYPEESALSLTLALDGVLVPDLFGVKLDAVQKTLAQHQLQTGAIIDVNGKPHTLATAPLTMVVLHQLPAPETVINPARDQIRLVISAMAQEKEKPVVIDPPVVEKKDLLNRPGLTSLVGHLKKYAQATGNTTLYKEPSLPGELSAYLTEIRALLKQGYVEPQVISQSRAKGENLVKAVDTRTNECQDQEELLGYLRRLVGELADAANPGSKPRGVFNRKTVVSLVGHIREYAQATGAKSMFKDAVLPKDLLTYADDMLHLVNQSQVDPNMATQARTRGESLIKAVDIRTNECQDQEELLGYLRRLVSELAEAGKTP